MYRPRAKLGPQKIVGNGEVATHRASQPSTAQPTSTGTAAREPASQRNKWPRAAPFGESEISIVEIGVITPRGAWVGRVSTAKKNQTLSLLWSSSFAQAERGLGGRHSSHLSARMAGSRVHSGRRPGLRAAAAAAQPAGRDGRAAVCRGRRSRTGFVSAP